MRYLSSGVIRGVGEKIAARIVNRFGADALRVMQNEPDRLAEIRGISAEAARRIAAEMAERQEYQELALLLSPYGIGPAQILRIHRTFGVRARAIIQENPFRLADEIQGIGFRTADRIAQSLHVAPDSPFRLRSALRYVLSQAAASGPYLSAGGGTGGTGCFASGPHREHRRPGIHPHGHIRADRPFPSWGAGEHPACGLEIPVCGRKPALPRGLSYLASCPVGDRALLDRIDHLAEESGITLADDQRKALVCSCESGISLITGGPGTGKTLLIRLLVQLFEERDLKVMLAAPTGQAAKRMSQSSGKSARTLHRLLEAQFSGPDSDRAAAGPLFRRNADYPLETDVLIIDEISMVDVVLLHATMTALPEGAHLVLVGDADQLPSVGPGNILRDILSAGSLPHTRLTQIYRQAQSSRIVRNAHRINRGVYPEFDQRDDSDFLYIPRKTPEEMADAAVALCRRILPERYGYDPMRDIQVIAPSRKGPAGIPVLNGMLQAALNPRAKKGPSVSSRGFGFTAGDRVMHTVNDYELKWTDEQSPPNRGEGIFNGETGVVADADDEDGTLEVVFDGQRHVRYDRALLDELEPAYAVTVHKSQGGEYPVVVLILPPGPPMLLTRNLLYTAVTRARDRLFLVSSETIPCAYDPKPPAASAAYRSRLEVAGRHFRKVSGRCLIPRCRTTPSGRFWTPCTQPGAWYAAAPIVWPDRRPDSVLPALPFSRTVVHPNGF